MMCGGGTMGREAAPGAVLPARVPGLSRSVTWILILLVVLVLQACEGGPKVSGGAPEAVDSESALEHARRHAVPSYVCPMHPQIVRDEPGGCPICGMDLVPKDAESGPGERQILYWVAPMDPGYRRDQPGKSPMGMEMVPVYADNAGPEVTISPAVVNNLGVRTAPVEFGPLWRLINTVGYVDFDESRISHIHMRTEGWIERLLVQSEGERVRRGAPLFDVYSPELINAQEEYQQALKVGSRNLVRASEDRLKALGISPGQISQLKKERRVPQTVRYFAPQDGIVATLNVREGMYAGPALEILSLADLSEVWVLVEVFERQADWVRVGQSAEVWSPFVPGRSWEGAVEYVYPTLDARTRTLKVRLRFPNPEEELKPNMYADVRIFGGPKKDVLMIPREALVRTGENDRVILALGEGRFVARNVIPGIESGAWVEVISGLKEGERVVTSGQFLIDSESSLKASLGRMSGPSEIGIDEGETP